MRNIKGIYKKVVLPNVHILVYSYKCKKHFLQSDFKKKYFFLKMLIFWKYGKIWDFFILFIKKHPCGRNVHTKINFIVIL